MSVLVPVTALGTAFDNEDAFGGWKLYVCDGTSGTDGTFNLLTVATHWYSDGCFYSPTQQGSAISETYFMPWPENHLWTAAGSIFDPRVALALGDDEAGTTYDGRP